MIANWKRPYLQEPHGTSTRPRKPQPDFAQLHEELQRHPHLTLQLAWEEYRQAHPDGYAYSRFCELYQRWREQLDVVLRQEHAAGEKLFVDYAGATIPSMILKAGRSDRPRSSSLSWGPARHLCRSHREPGVGALDRLAHPCLRISRRGSRLVIPDNTRTGVNRACRYEPDLNRTYHELAMHYGVGVLPTDLQASRQSQGRNRRTDRPALDCGGAAASEVL